MSLRQKIPLCTVCERRFGALAYGFGPRPPASSEPETEQDRKRRTAETLIRQGLNGLCRLNGGPWSAAEWAETKEGKAGQLQKPCPPFRVTRGGM